MPCRDREGEEIQHPYVDPVVEPALCAICTVLEQELDCPFKELLSRVDWKEAGITRRDFEAWWNKHKREDAARRRAEDEQRKQDVLIQKALSKLTAEERRLVRFAR